MNNIQVFDDIQQLYLQFLENKNYPKLENLNNWGKNRYFFNQQYYCLDTGSAPDFMDKERYMTWLMEELLV